jgi:hypothetical protein
LPSHECATSVAGQLPPEDAPALTLEEPADAPLPEEDAPVLPEADPPLRTVQPAQTIVKITQATTMTNNDLFFIQLTP